MNQRGFTLIELLVVIVIMGILLTIAGINFNYWTVKTDVERETREMLADFSDYRLRAIHTKLPVRAFLNQNRYEFRIYNSLDELKGGVAPGTSVLDKQLRFPIRNAAGAPYNNFHVNFDSSGVARDDNGDIFNPDPVNNPTPVVMVVNSGTGVDAGVDCIIVDNLKTKMGTFNNATSTCTPK